MSVDKNDNRGSVMMKAVATAADTAERVSGQQGSVQTLYLEALTLVERLHRRLLDVIKDEFDRRGRADINSVQALLLYNIGDKELTAGELPHRRLALPEARQDGRTGRRHLGRGVLDPEQIAAPPRAVLDRPNPVSSLSSFRRDKAKPARNKTGKPPERA
jgi:hypothetical protein